MKIIKRIKSFFAHEKAGGIVLIACTLFSLVLSNSACNDVYQSLWHISIFQQNVEYWINDGLMAIFFLLIGLELKREIYQGELSNVREAFLPIFGALGGMLVPAGIYVLFNIGSNTQSGAGIPMATDIAFALGILSLLGNKVPTSLKIFLTALAVIDDLGAIIVIALFYTQTLILANLFIALSIFMVLLFCNYFKLRFLIIYLLGGIAMWYFMLHSGVHATISGVLLAFAIPFNNGSEEAASYKLGQFLHFPITFLILPLFALANTAITIGGQLSEMLLQPYSIGILCGLLIGKPLGILLFSYIATKIKLCQLPSEINWQHIFGVGILGGIGFTMSIFITLLSFEQLEIINNSKLTILISSALSSLVGLLVLKLTLKKEQPIVG